MVINLHRVDLSFNPLPASGFSKEKQRIRGQAEQDRITSRAIKSN
jgi:hypothetical protein